MEHATWLFYIAGQMLHFILKANAVVVSGKGNSYSAYFLRYWVVLAVRFFAATCIFIIVVRGSAAVFGEAFLPNLSGLDVWVKAAICGLIGLATDSILDKVVMRWEWLKGQVPEAPTGQTFIGQKPEDK